MNKFRQNFGFTDVTKSQFEIGFWELLPALVLFVLIAVGLLRVRQARQRKKHEHQQRSLRKKLSLPLFINTSVTQEFSVRTFDISMTGAFLSYDDLKHSMTFTSLIGKRSGIKVGDLIEIKVPTRGFGFFKCQAKVVRYNFSEERPPKGVGIQFVNLNNRKRRMLADLIEAEDLAPTA